MPITSRTYNTTPGATIFQHPSISGVVMLGVARNGDLFDRIVFGATADSHEFSYGSARVIFSPLLPFLPDEKLWLIFET